MRIGDFLGQLDPSQVIPAAAAVIPGLTPTPDNPLGIPGLGGPLVVPQLPGAPLPGGLPVPGGQLPQLPPGQQTDPNNPRVGPLPGGPQQTPVQQAGGAMYSIGAVAAAAAVALGVGFLVARVT